MNFKSKEDYNLKRKTIVVECGDFFLDDGEHVRAELDKVRKAYEGKTILFKSVYKDGYDGGASRQYLVSFYMREETDEEYAKRIALLEFDDIQDTIKAIAGYRNVCSSKSAIREMYDRICGTKRNIAPWCKELLESFLSEETLQEKISAAYQKGKESVEKDLKDLKKKLKSLTQ
jgi:hypothetical protein